MQVVVEVDHIFQVAQQEQVELVAAVQVVQKVMKDQMELLIQVAVQVELEMINQDNQRVHLHKKVVLVAVELW
jgi:diadenosine tetraphosphate (Ap4A) HIT family hydrolase